MRLPVKPAMTTGQKLVDKEKKTMRLPVKPAMTTGRLKKTSSTT